MRYSDLPRYIKDAWHDRKALEEISAKILEVFQKKGQVVDRLLSYLKRIKRQLHALYWSAKLFETRLKWKRTKLELETFRRSLEGYEKESGASKGSEGHRTALYQFTTLIEAAKGYHREWYARKSNGNYPCERLPQRILARLLRGVEDIQGTRLPDGGRRYIWEAPEYKQYIPQGKIKPPAWLLDEETESDDFLEVEDGED